MSFITDFTAPAICCFLFVLSSLTKGFYFYNCDAIKQLGSERSEGSAV
jgi:hypothetical protein